MKIKIPLVIKFSIGMSAILTAALTISFSVLADRQEKMIMAQVEREARVLFKQIVITRTWIADHGGIYVEKLPWMKANPYLKDTGFTNRGGKHYLVKTPAMVTKELSQYAGKQGLYWFHITSLKLTNPENAPDAFEREAIKGFEEKRFTELFSLEKIEREKVLRYIAPLYVEESCLRCHSRQGYRVGDIRGAISITLPVNSTLAAIAENRRDMFVAGLLTLLALLAGIFFMINKLVLAPARSLKRTMKEFSAGHYSAAAIIETGDEFEALSKSFSSMAAIISDHHATLHERVAAATRELEGANRLLQEASQRKSDFIAGASHELRTPLTAIKGAMDYISTRLSGLTASQKDEAVIEDLKLFFDLIKKNAERMIRMISDMLDLERIESGLSELNFSEIDLVATSDEVIRYFQVESERRHIRFERSGEPSVHVCADEDRLRQVLINLFSNALKYAPDSSAVSVKIRVESDKAVITVCDEGPGVSEEERERVFDKFYRRGDREGTGLGLAVCRSIAEAHGGTILVTANEPSGACFIFSLPINCSSDRSAR